MGGSDEPGAAIGARALEHDRYLSVDLGPRGSCTEAERRGSEYAAAEMARWAAEVKVEPFRCYSTYALPWGLVAALTIASGILLWLSPAAGLVVAAANLPLYVALASGRADVGFLFPKRPSQNVWGRVPARRRSAEADASAGPGGAAGGSATGRRRRVVLLAHVDSTRAALLYAPKALKNLRASHMLNLVSTLTVFAAALGGFLAPSALGVARIVASVFALVSVYALASLVHRQLLMPYVAGANDNASGVGLTLALGEHYARAPLSGTELWCVITGAEETGYPAGARRFVEAHLGELRESEILVLDNIGAGDLRHLRAEGIILPLPMDPGLLALARRLGAAHPDWQVRDSVCNLGYTDATPAILAGCRTLALWAEGSDGFLKNYHWPTDTFENVEPETLRRAATLVTEIIGAIDRGEDQPRGGSRYGSPRSL